MKTTAFCDIVSCSFPSSADDGGSMHLLNVGLLQRDSTVLYSGRLNICVFCLFEAWTEFLNIKKTGWTSHSKGFVQFCYLSSSAMISSHLVLPYSSVCKTFIIECCLWQRLSSSSRETKAINQRSALYYISWFLCTLNSMLGTFVSQCGLCSEYISV
jgi:hypothetical protein